MGFFSDLLGGKKTQAISIPPPGPQETQLTGDLAGIVAKLRADLEGVRTVEELNAAVEPIFALAARRGGEALQTRAIEAAGARGLQLSDSPIAAPLLREQRELTEGLAAARASAILDLQQRAIANRLSLGQLATGGVQTLGGIRTRQATVTTRDPLAGIEGIGGLLDLGGAVAPVLKKAASGIFSLFR